MEASGFFSLSFSFLSFFFPLSPYSSTIVYLHLGYQEWACFEGLFTTASSSNLFYASLQEEKAPERAWSWQVSQATLRKPRLCTRLVFFFSGDSLQFWQTQPVAGRSLQPEGCWQGSGSPAPGRERLEEGGGTGQPLRVPADIFPADLPPLS